MAHCLDIIERSFFGTASPHNLLLPHTLLLHYTKTDETNTPAVGQRVFGENYAQEICEKAPKLPDDIQWHFIGTLQSNKVKPLFETVKNLYCVEGVSSLKLARTLDKNWNNATRKLNVFVQVNTSQEDSKDGVEPGECKELVKQVITTCPNLAFCGLMTIGKLGDPTPACFELLAKLRQDILSDAELSKICLPLEKFELSMGMSGDYEMAVKCGATNVRVGSTIFGARAPKPKAASSSADAVA